MFSSADELLAETEFVDMLQEWLRSCKVDNMCVERQFALIRRSSVMPLGQKPPLERMVSTGYLSQWLQEYRANGFDVQGDQSRQGVCELGAPLRCRKRKLSAVRGTCGFFTFCAQRRQHRLAKDGAYSRAEAAHERRRLSAEWAAMSHDDRQRFRAQELQGACARRDQDQAAQDVHDSIREAKLKRCCFGLADAKYPYGEEAFRGTVEQTVGTPEAGFFKQEGALRDRFLRDVVVVDEGRPSIGTDLSDKGPVGVALNKNVLQSLNPPMNMELWSHEPQGGVQDPWASPTLA